MDNKTLLRWLQPDRLDACGEAREWVEEHGGTLAEAWRDCKRGDWMAWFIGRMQGKLHITRQQLVLALCDCAALSLKYFEQEYLYDKRPREVIKTARKWARGQATDQELDAAITAAYDAATNAAYDAATNAAYDAATNAAYDAANAANAATNAANAAYAANAAIYDKTLLRCANIFRRHFPDIGKDTK